MDTPEKNQIGTPISKFEDSPVFSYINTLSPIKPVKSVHIGQTFHSLSIASPPSVFTSPHTTYQKESRFLVRHHLSFFSKADFSSDNGDESNTSAGISDGVQLSDRLAGTQENFNSGSFMKEVTNGPPTEHSKLPVELPQTLKYDCGSPNSNATPFYGVKMDPKIEIPGTPASIVQFVQDGSIERRHSFESEVELGKICELEKTKEEEPEGCEWENLISSVADELLIFDPSTESESCKGQVQNKVDNDASSLSSVVSKLPEDNIDDSQKPEPVGSLGSFHQLAIRDGLVDPLDLGEQKETHKSSHVLSSGSQNEEGIRDPSDKIEDKAGNCIAFGCEVEAQQHRGMRRRCLVFEVAGAPKQNLEDDSNSSFSMSLQSEVKFASDNKQLVPFKPTIVSSPHVLPGIGLHLNSLATSSKDCRIVNQETLTSGRRLISLPSSVPSFHSLTAGRRPLSKSVGSNSSERDLGPTGNEVQVVQDASGAHAIGTSEEFNQSSPKKKRRRLENAGENEACKRCNCKKSKCLKLYCECFAAGVYCVEPCSCQECFNKPVHEDTVLATRKQIESRNPLAFAPKVIRSTEPVPDIGEEVNTTPASARHKRGCNCKKSSCLKKYCECYQGGVGCSSHCRCEGCKNAFGRKDGTVPIGIEEAEAEEDETEDRAKVGLDGSLQIIEAQKDEQQHSERVLPVTPFQICRPPVNLSLLSSGKPPRSSLHAVGSSPRLKTCQTLRKFENMYPQPKFEKHFQINPEDETPKILTVTCSPTNGVKNASPKGKRVSPPHNEIRLSPSRRNGRKLILQSIPSFPSLTHHGFDDFMMKYR